MKEVHDFDNHFISLDWINNTFITLIPMIEGPANITDYRTISCINILYKILSKVLASRLRSVLSSIISPSQSALLEGRYIHDSVLITNEIVSNILRRGDEGFLLKLILRRHTTPLTGHSYGSAWKPLVLAIIG